MSTHPVRDRPAVQVILKTARFRQPDIADRARPRRPKGARTAGARSPTSRHLTIGDMVAPGEPFSPIADPLLQLRFSISNVSPVQALASHATALLAPYLVHLSSYMRQTTLWYTTRMPSLVAKPELPTMVAHHLAATCRHAPPLLIMAGFALTAYSIVNSHLQHRTRALHAPVPDAQPTVYSPHRLSERALSPADVPTATMPSLAHPQPWHTLSSGLLRAFIISSDYGHRHGSCIIETNLLPPEPLTLTTWKLAAARNGRTTAVCAAAGCGGSRNPHEPAGF